jgi:hypothetical protein
MIFENDFLAQHPEMADTYSNIKDQIAGMSYQEFYQSTTDQIESAAEMIQEATRRTNGLKIVEQLRSQADTLDGERIVIFDDGWGGTVGRVHDEDELIEKATLNEAANQLEQYLIELGSDGMFSDSEREKFWEEARYLNGADIVDQMRNNAANKKITAELERYINNLGTDAMCSNRDLQKFWEEERYIDSADIVHQMRNEGNNDLKEAFSAAAPKFEQYVDDLGTDGKCSIKDVGQFFKTFLSEYENPYQASEVIRNYLTTVGSSNSPYTWGENPQPTSSGEEQKAGETPNTNQGYIDRVIRDWGLANGGEYGALAIGMAGATSTLLEEFASGMVAAGAKAVSASIAAYEFGALAGAMLNNIPAGNGQTVGEWWTDRIWDYNHPQPSPNISGPFPVPTDGSDGGESDLSGGMNTDEPDHVGAGGTTAFGM